MLRRIFIGGAILAVALIASGCGGGDDEGDGGQPLSKSEFIKQADAICTKGVKAKDAAFQTSLGKTSKEKISIQEKQEKVILAGIAPFKTMTEELAELQPPEEDEEQVEEFVEALESSVSGVEEEPRSALDASQPVFEESNTLAGDYGLKACSNL